MTRHTIREIAAAAALTVVIAVPSVVTVRAQSPAGLPDLIGALKATPGVLGVDATRQTANGKMVIFTWFENKKAVLDWYYSDMHLALMMQYSSGADRSRGPLADMPDDGRPILAIASMTMPGGVPPNAGDVRSAVTQMAIEFYAPLPGGSSAGGRFAPSTVKVQGLVEGPIVGRTAAAGR
jgi:hypothetical protein